jgi:hypothetical protein
MINNPDTLQFWINVFLIVAAVSVAFAFVALAVGVRELRRPVAAPATPAPGQHLDEVTSAPARHAA